MAHELKRFGLRLFWWEAGTCEHRLLKQVVQARLLLQQLLSRNNYLAAPRTSFLLLAPARAWNNCIATHHLYLPISMGGTETRKEHHKREREREIDGE